MRLKFRELVNIIYFLVLVLLTFYFTKSIFNQNYEIKKKHDEKILKWNRSLRFALAVCSLKDKKQIDKQDLKKKLLNKLKEKKLQNKSINSKTENKNMPTSKRKTSDGYKIYTEEELGLNIKCKFLNDSMTKDQHKKTVLKIKEDIKNGLIFQCEVGFKSHYEIKGDQTAIYEKLRNLNPSPHMYFMKFCDQVIIGASPELLFRLRNGEMETFPLAGTTKRGKDKLEDLKLARELLNDKKEIAEHNMLVDLHRNDLGRVAKFGTVKVRNLMDIKKYSHVQHISSEIAGIISEEEDMFSALASNFPAGTLSGAPKIEAMKIINEIEEEGRGPYGGAIGQFGFNGDCTFAIPIRSIFITGEQAYAQTCGGNVYDSDPDKEYLEIERKLAAMKTVLASFEEKEIK